MQIQFTALRRSQFRAAGRACLLAATLLGGIAPAQQARAAGAADDTPVTAGLGRYYLKPHGGLLGDDPLPPVAEARTADAKAQAAPTNQWYTSLIWEGKSFPIHAHPMTYLATAAGLEIGQPVKQTVVTTGSRREIRYPHHRDLLVSANDAGGEPRFAGHSDWLVKLRYGDGTPNTMDVSLLHGDPFSYFELSAGDVHVNFPTKPEVISDPSANGADPRILVVRVDGRAYGLFAAKGARWESTSPTEYVLHFVAPSRYLSVAGLPDATAATVQQFSGYAYAFPIGTRAAPVVDLKKSEVRTTFTVDTVAKEGDNRQTLMGLYPHHWAALADAPRPAAKFSYETVRGTLRLIPGNSFTTVLAYRGFVPALPGLTDPADRAAVDSLLGGDEAKVDQLFLKKGRGTYWIGKGLGGVAQLASIAEAEGKTDMRNGFLRVMTDRLGAWFDGKHPTYFMQDRTLGTFVGYPQEYASVTSMNDHHFHYGYWIAAAAHVALRDPDWASNTKWGPMVDKLVADIATDERGRADFPYLRNFDPYEGHSWASGDAKLEDGNNQESSSEAINAWAALILWGEATGNERVRDLGIYLYTSEIDAVRTYWFDQRREVLANDFGKPFASMVFGGKYSYNTWWTEEPRQIMGINVVPITPASTYLASDPAQINTLLAFLPGEQKRYNDAGITDGTPADIWQDVLVGYQALGDPEAAIKSWNKHGSVEFGETRTHTLFWLLSLKEMGTPDLSISADSALYAVFRAKSGARTYLAYNAGSVPRDVTFSTGKVLTVPARSLARETEAAPL